MVTARQVPWENSPNTNFVDREAAFQGHRKSDHICRQPSLWSKEYHCHSAEGQMLLHHTGEYHAVGKTLGNVSEHKQVSVLNENSNYLTNKDALWKAQTVQLEMQRMQRLIWGSVTNSTDRGAFNQEPTPTLRAVWSTVHIQGQDVGAAKGNLLLHTVPVLQPHGQNCNS